MLITFQINREARLGLTHQMDRMDTDEMERLIQTVANSEPFRANRKEPDFHPSSICVHPVHLRFDF